MVLLYIENERFMEDEFLKAIHFQQWAESYLIDNLAPACAMFAFIGRVLDFVMLL